MTRILLADRHPVCRLGLYQLISEQGWIVQLDEAATEVSLLALIRKHNYQLIIVDPILAEVDAKGLIRTLRKRAPDTPILIFAQGREIVFGPRMLQAGAMGYVEKAAPCYELVTAMRRLIEGRRYVGHAVTEQLVVQSRQSLTAVSFAHLSAREAEVAHYLWEGRSMGDISGLLAISYSTVHTLKRRMFEKLHLKNVLELAQLYDALGPAR